MSQIQIPKGWIIENLNEQIANFEKRNPKVNPEKEFKYVEIGSIGPDKKINNFKKILGKNAPSRARNVIRENDVIFGTTRPYYRNVVLIPKKFDDEICTTGFCVLRIKKSKLDPKFLFYYMLSDSANNQILKPMRGGSYPAVSNKDVTSIKIPIPPFKIQKKIIAILDNIFTQLEEKKKILLKLQAKKKIYLKSLSHETLGTTFSKIMKFESSPSSMHLMKIDDVCEGIQPGFAEGQKNVNGGIIHLRMNNIGTDFKLNFDLVRTINATDEKIKKYKLNKEDIIFNNTNSTTLVGKSAIFNSDKDCLYSNHLTRLSVKKDILYPEWLLFYLRTRWLQRDFEKMCNKWVNQAAINRIKMKNLEISIPSLSIQKEVIKKLKSTDSSFNSIKNNSNLIIEHGQKIIDYFNDLNYRILHEVFVGKLN